MAKLKKLLFAALLTAAAILSIPKDSFASQCSICEATAQCVPCCRCGGGPFQYCDELCS